MEKQLLQGDPLDVMYFGKMLSIDKFHNWLLFMDVGNNCVGYYSLANYNSFNWFTNCGLSPTDGGIVASPLTGDIYYIYYGKIMRLVLPETYTIFSASTPDWNPYPEYPPFNDANFTATPWNNPMGLYYTAHDELFVADPGLKQVKKIQNRQVEIIAGSTNSSSGCPDNSDPVNCYLDSPFNVFVRENKNEIYIADDVAGLIKKVYPYCDGVGYVLSGDGRTCLPECYGKSSESKYPFLACHGNGTCVDVNTCMCNENYYGPECTVTTCFGKFSNSSTACNGNGICERYNYCKCNSNYGGENCEIPKCNGTLANDETVCSGNGSCIALNTCQCFNTSRYVGEKCEIPVCFGIIANQTSSVCSGRGDCVSHDTCVCRDQSQWNGLKCDVPKCNLTSASDPTVCNSRGQCISPNQCQCFDTYAFGGNDCQILKCNGTLSTMENVCNGRGNCLADDICKCNDETHWGGRFCSIPKCNGILAGNSSQCLGRGDCLSPDTCQCYDSNSYGGNDCQIFKCAGIMSTNTTHVCSKRGICKSLNLCECEANYGGSNCELVKCFGILQNETSSVCKGRGTCSNVDTCHCNNGYGGAECELIQCFGIFTNQTNAICNNGNGTCISPDSCQCNPGWIGSKCEIPICHGKYSNDTQVCSSKGQCLTPNNCKCSTDYFGANCEKTTCNSIASDNANVCFGHGSCPSYNNCNCSAGYGPATTCQFPICFGILANESNACNDTDQFCYAPNDCKPKNPLCFGIEKMNNRSCSGNGICLSTDNCICDSNYFGEKCQYWKCNHVAFNSTTVCSSHGSCDAVNYCSCSDGYGGSNCELVKCSGILQNDSSVCSGKGNCTDVNSCDCVHGYYGSDCQFTSCFGIEQASSQVCNFRNGTCQSFDNCKCLDESRWYGLACNLTYCFGLSSVDHSNVCNSHGDCVNYDTCQCRTNYIGNQCQFRYFNQSDVTISFNSTNDFVGEISTTLTINIQDSQFIDFYKNKTIDINVDFLLNGQSISSQIFQYELLSKMIFNIPSSIPKGSLTAKTTLHYNSTQISTTFETMNPLSIKERIKPSASPKSSSSVPPPVLKSLSEPSRSERLSSAISLFSNVALISTVLVVGVVFY
ncbi:hypothetical protein NAEGRDRAFT_49505 [Naegleria gruberi]|uniref:EGF-like domain-containing protein n=1 Tax=Naegleria gruberi TaxID=5762 RepID=D2VH00_NAEGR|nr:uncharacterized protein NAEGRDRAFT_49505 [Naegleria gruberi]EFC43896.1 hypothetical protein NAEGRDRAFT_49505 [Naegleria gruberi]|eukprot:XP_002676640.1 hypothetical protein NAEGRDRAFT_49505 [Naegleria gruberi strain NEG-M]